MGLVVLTNEELEKAEAVHKESEEHQQQPEVSALVAYILHQFEINRNHKRFNCIDEEMLEDLRQRNDEYDPDKLSHIKAHGGSEVFIGYTGTKCRAAESWISDILAGDDKLARFMPTPVPELSPEQREKLANYILISQAEHYANFGEQIPQSVVMEFEEKLRELWLEEERMAAEQAARGMQKKIEDQLEEAGFSQVLEEVIYDVVTLKCGILKGPIPRKREALSWSRRAGKPSKPVLKESTVWDFRRVSPFDAYPSPHATQPHEGNFIEVVPYTPKSLTSMIGVEGYFDADIRSILSEYTEFSLRDFDYTETARRELEDKDGFCRTRSGIFEGLEYWGSVSGLELLKHDITRDDRGELINSTDYYEINAIVVANKLIYLRFNDHPLGSRPYSKTVYAEVPGSFWGKGVPRLMRELQKICNGSTRALVNNMAIASGPQVYIPDMDRVPAGQDISSMSPWKIWQFEKSRNGTTEMPINFFQPRSNAAELLGVLESFKREADDITGIPAYTYGNERISGAGRTASGLSMLMNNASKGMKKIVARMSIDLLFANIEKLYIYNMLYDRDESIKGDLRIVPTGFMQKLLKEQTIQRRLEFLQITQNPTDLSIMGMQGRAAHLRALEHDLDMPGKRGVPDEEDMARRERAAQKAAQMRAQMELNKEVVAS